jgi:hypothetical protein
MAEARRDDEDREDVGSLPIDRLLVFVAKPGHQDDLTSPVDGRFSELLFAKICFW